MYMYTDTSVNINGVTKKKFIKKKNNCDPQNNLDCYYNNIWKKDNELFSYESSVDNFTIIQNSIDNSFYNYITDIDFDINSITDNMCRLRDSFYKRNNSSFFIELLLKKISIMMNIIDLADLIYFFLSHNITNIFSINVEKNFINPDIYCLSLRSGIMINNVNIHENDYLSDKNMVKMIHEIYLFIEKNYSNIILSDIESFTSDIMVMIKLLGKFYESIVNADNPHDFLHNINYKKFKNKFPNIFWQIFLNNFLKNDNDIIIYENYNFLKFFDIFLSDYDQKKNSIMKNFMIFALVNNFSKYLNIGPLNNDYYRSHLSGKSTIVELFYNSFGFYLQNNIYEIQNKNINKEKIINEIFENIKNYCLNFLEKSNFFSQFMNEYIKKKISNLEIIIGKIDHFIDLTNMKPLSHHDFFLNLSIINNFYFHHFIDMMGSPIINRKKYLQYQDMNECFSFRVNAYYDASNNSIFVPTSIMNDIFVNVNYPAIYNYGGIGVIIAHEIIHSIDDIGIQFDYSGHLYKIWNINTINDKKIYYDEINKINHHYDSLKYKNNKIISKPSISENISDILGIKICFRTYVTKYVKSNISQERQYLRKFFKRWAQSLRSNNDSDFAKQESNSDHLPNTIRINAPFSHLWEYYLLFDVRSYHNNYLEPAARVKIFDY